MGPKKSKPPKTEKRVKSGCNFIPLPISLGPIKLSIKPTAKAPQSARPTAENKCPLTNINITAGTKTKEVPRLGTKAAKQAAVPQRIALGKAKIVKPIVAKTP